MMDGSLILAEQGNLGAALQFLNETDEKIQHLSHTISHFKQMIPFFPNASCCLDTIKILEQEMDRVSFARGELYTFIKFIE